MEKETMTELERVNKTAMISHLLMAGITLIFCIMQAVRDGNRYILLAVITVLALGPVIAEFTLWRKNHETPAIKHLVAIGFACFYSVVLFTTSCNMAYVFVIPMIMVVTLYNDVKYFILINVGTILESIIVVVLGARTGGFGYLGVEAGVIEITVMVMVGILSI